MSCLHICFNSLCTTHVTTATRMRCLWPSSGRPARSLQACVCTAATSSGSCAGSRGSPQHLHLWQLRAWTAFCSEWQEPHLQHDAAEFLQHLAPALHSSTSLGWEARLGVDGEAFAQVVDQGQLFPLVLHSALDPALQSRNTPVSLQKLLISWRKPGAPARCCD